MQFFTLTKLPKCLNKQFTVRVFSLSFPFLVMLSRCLNVLFFTSNCQCEGILINVLVLANPKFPVRSFLVYSYLCEFEIYYRVLVFHPTLFTKHQNSSVRWNNAI